MTLTTTSATSALRNPGEINPRRVDWEVRFREVQAAFDRVDAVRVFPVAVAKTRADDDAPLFVRKLFPRMRPEQEVAAVPV